ncbi:hypothetical protein RM572_15600 [Streptomyces sp. DSM 42041]|uniref:PNPLA domain-containing protein n=1 Tax=Streptomyces hazeniae TaxID=3075538 RepID=A0ABU2NT74_9ACTN|nr:hypothetical protein [Streptomyces sp. DSM 42041]MDT0380184.1 hypothetical protein [Streptomyces sp. DSM 42041]
MGEEARRTLVLGGGALNGEARAIGILAGLADAELELGDADLVSGASAGAVIGTQLSMRTLARG